MVELTLAQAKAIVAMFGGDEDPDVTISVRDGKIGHSGPGLYAWFTDLAEEGSVFLPEQDEPPCPDCKGSGADGDVPCGMCSGTGKAGVKGTPK